MTEAYGLPAGNPGGGGALAAPGGGSPAAGGQPPTAPLGGVPTARGAAVAGGALVGAALVGGAPALGGSRVSGGVSTAGGAPSAARSPIAGGSLTTSGAPTASGAPAAGGSPAPGGPGHASAPGSKGGMGAMGGAGAMGSTGGAGAMGIMGATDAMGSMGGTNATGATDSMGAMGATGGTGATGTAGGTGAVDAAGVPGPAGGVPASAAAGAGGAGPDDTGAPRRVRVVLVDDHRMFRTGVQAEIGDTARTGVEVVGEAADVDQAVTVITATRPEVVLLDVHLPGGGGVEVLRRSASMMADQNRPVRFLALSVSDAAEDVIGVIRGGARGYVTKTITGTDLVDAIFRVAEGDAVFSPRLAGFVLDAFASTDAPPVDEDLDRLTQREREVLRLIARGYAYKEIAKQLFISVKTVESHVSAVLRKLQLSNRHELTRWATARRLV